MDQDEKKEDKKLPIIRILGDIIIDSTYTKRIIREYYEKFYANNSTTWMKRTYSLNNTKYKI